MWIKTLPVYSRLAEESTLPSEVAARLPPGWRLAQHQVETYRQLVGGKAEVIFNTALTGDGKSLAGQLPTLIQDWRHPLLAMYPTNELINDQERQWQRSILDWQVRLSHPALLNAAELDRIMEEDDYGQRSDALMSVLRNHEVVLTNPDIFHLIMHCFYLRPDDAPDKLIGPLLQKFPQLTFDEFHIFETPQVISVINALLLLHELGGEARPHRYLFLSATPGELMLEYLERSGLRVQQIRGQYCHSENPPEPGQWRRILHAATIHFDTTPRTETWVVQHVDDTVLPFFQAHGPGAKGAIIVNSVATAYRLLDFLRPRLAAHGLRVEPNTGLTSRERRKISYEADLLIGTSTVDVGVDFQINFLIFESRDAGSFLQRLGRLGRHEGYTREGQFYQFSDFVAYALVPDWVHGALFEGRDGNPRLLEPEGVVDREQLNAAIQSAYPPPAKIESYAQLWGSLQTTRILQGFNHPTIREEYGETRLRLQRRYEATFGFRLNAAMARYRDLCTRDALVLREARSFRGGSYFTCGLVDPTEAGAHQFKIADLLMLIANADLKLIEEDDFYASAARVGVTQRLLECNGEYQPLAYFELCGWCAERKNYEIVLDCDVRGWGAERFGQAQSFKRWQLKAMVPGITQLNRRLEQRLIPALLCLGFKPVELKRRLHLPWLFSLYEFVSRDEITGCVAFGRESLVLEARLRYANLNCGGNSMIF